VPLDPQPPDFAAAFSCAFAALLLCSLATQCLFPNTHRWSASAVDNCRTLIAEMKQDLASVQIGTTMVLYRAEQHRDMELRRNLAVEAQAIYIQKHVS
jgi:myosin heavy subunit